MILIADSGSTKCDWRMVDKSNKVTKFETPGINPYFHDGEFIHRVLMEQEVIRDNRKKITHIFFYGAGCSSKKLKIIVEDALHDFFPNANINVDHDMVAAAFAVYEGDPCICCILGTGSNSCHFDGDIVREEVPALAYILGDEASGSYFGKKLLANYLYKRLPGGMSEALSREYGLTKDIILENVYMKPNANVYLASFMPFITRFKHEPVVRDFLARGFREFINIHVKCYADYDRVKTHFIGSIARYHQDILEGVCKSEGLLMGKVLKRPISGLLEYHKKNYFEHLKL